MKSKSIQFKGHFATERERQDYNRKHPELLGSDAPTADTSVISGGAVAALNQTPVEPTLGPWHTCGLEPHKIHGSIIRICGRHIGPIYPTVAIAQGCAYGSNKITDEELVVNARLIAAAPDLLAALQALMDDVASYGLFHPELQGTFEPDSLELARAAFIKATEGSL